MVSLDEELEVAEAAKSALDNLSANVRLRRRTLTRSRFHCDAAIGMMGGYITVESKPGAGSTFTIRPTVAATPQDAVVMPTPAQHTPDHGEFVAGAAT